IPPLGSPRLTFLNRLPGPPWNAVSAPLSFAPFFLLFTLHGRRICVLHFEPIGRAPRTVGGILALRDDAFEAKLAGVGEDGRAVALDMFVEPDAGAGLGYDRCERGPANLKRIAPQVVPVQLDEVEGIKKDAPVSALVPDEIERSNAVVIAGDSFAIDDARPRAQMGQRLDDQREAAGGIVAPGAIGAHPRGRLAGTECESARP